MSSMITLPHAIAIREWATVTFMLDLEQDWQFFFDLLEGEKPVNLFGKKLQLDIRPSFYHATLVRRLGSRVEDGQEIVIGDALAGQAGIVVPQATIKAALDPSVFRLRTYAHTLKLIDDTVSGAGQTRTVWRGYIKV